MRHVIAVGAAVLSLGGSGCALVHDTVSLTAYTVKESVQDCRETKRNQKWAEQAWKNVRRCNPDAVYTEDYEAGFEDGFAHYLFRGGNGEPPPLPPRHYRKLAYQTPEGYRAIEDWFEGYRYGAIVARESGYREFVTGPSAFRNAVPMESPVAGPVPASLPASITEPLPGRPAAPPAEPIGEPRPNALPAADTRPGPRIHARILSIRSLGPVMQPEP
jgi:hypothetical protein